MSANSMRKSVTITLGSNLHAFLCYRHSSSGHIEGVCKGGSSYTGEGACKIASERRKMPAIDSAVKYKIINICAQFGIIHNYVHDWPLLTIVD